WIGCGVMGRWMCQHCMDAGYSATVYSRTAEKCQPLVERGAKLVNTPAKVAMESDVVFTMLGHPADVKEVIDGEDGVLKALRFGGTIVDMTTSEPNLARILAEKARQKQFFLLDAPVSGGDIGAREARLSIMCGGDEGAFNAVFPLLKCMGQSIHLMGAAGMGQHTKMMNQILIASNIIGVAEALLYAKRVGLDLEDTIAAVSGGAAGSWSLTNYGPKMVNRDFKPGFYVEHFIKDLGIALEEAKKMKLSLPGILRLTLAQSLYHYLSEQGHQRDGIHALILALEHLSENECVDLRFFKTEFVKVTA
ncbi:3-hydroxyisobutyrate dehydrogenase, partial [Cardiosporidium cionae]